MMMMHPTTALLPPQQAPFEFSVPRDPVLPDADVVGVSGSAAAGAGGNVSVQLLKSDEYEWSGGGGDLEVHDEFEHEQLQDWASFYQEHLADDKDDVGRGKRSKAGVDWNVTDDDDDDQELEKECQLHEWICSQRRDVMGRQQEDDVCSMPMDMSKQRRHLEQTVQILHSLAVKIVGEDSGGNMLDIGERKILVHPEFITVDNVMVRMSTTLSASGHKRHGQMNVSANFIRSDTPFCHECDEDQIKKKYAAMHAFARIAYAMCLMGSGPTLPDFPLRNVTLSEASMSIALSLHDDHSDGGGVEDEVEIIDMIRKQYRVADSEETNSSEFMSAMLDAGIPFAMRRFISDLLGDDFRSERAFASFEDVLSDLKQMVIYPDRFLHGIIPDRWKIVFDDKLYGRCAEMNALMIAADRMTHTGDDALDSRFPRSAGRNSEVVMVAGPFGAGKSHLVRCGGVCLEKKGWIFLRCKFDQGVHPEPLSVLTRAVDDYLRSLTLCSKCGIHHSSSSTLFLEYPCSGRSNDVCARIQNMIFPQGLGMLAKYIPSLNLLGDVVSPMESPGLNESMMISLLRKLLQAISSKQAPVLIFFDDLQWADPLSLSLLTDIVKGVCPGLNSSGNGSGIHNGDEETYIMLVGSYRDNEVDSNPPLAKVLHKFQADNSINVTNISLSGLPQTSLNEMLSDTLSMPVRRIRPLTELVIQKTDGHPLHVMEFIQALTVNNLLTHSFSKGWEWDVDSIDIFPITDSVAELYSFKLLRMPKDILLGVQILSCFGFQVDQQVLNFIADYDGKDSVDMNDALQAAMNEGLVERAGHLISFTHDMILKASIDSIHENDLVPLLRKLIAVLVKESSVAGSLDSVIFVVVDLINRIGSELTTESEERALFAELNLRAGMAAIAVPDFAGAATYAEHGISFLNDTCWETQYDLCIRLYETSVLSHFPSLTGDRRKLMQRINDVFKHARDLSDKFKTHFVWIQLLSATDISKGIEECLNLLEQLGEPLDLANVDHDRVCSDIAEQKEKNSELRLEGILSMKRLKDLNKVRAMKVMSLLLYLCNTKRFFVAFVSCKMVDLSMKYGTSDDTILGIAAFSSALVNISGYISDGIAWGRTALLLLKLSGDKPTIIPPVYAAVYGSVLLFAEPTQSTLEPLSECVRFAYDTGNLEYSIAGSMYYLLRSFSSGKNMRVLIGEVGICIRLAGNHFGNDSSSKTPSYNLFHQFFITPLYNILFELEGDAFVKDKSLPVCHVKSINNRDILNSAIALKRYNVVMAILIVQAPCALFSRNMDMALTYSTMYLEYFTDKPTTMLSGSVSHAFYDGLISFYFMRQTGDERYKIRGEKALRMLEGLLAYSEWNFKNKQLLLKAEFNYSMKNSSMAAICYEASIKAASKHKFIHEEALANELAGIFYLNDGKRQKSLSCFEQSTACYEAWGAFAVARRVKSFIDKEFRTSLGVPLVVTNPVHSHEHLPS